MYYGNDGAGGWQRLTVPLRTITTLDRFGLCEPSGDGPMLRMLQVPELARAMGWDSATISSCVAGRVATGSSWAAAGAGGAQNCTGADKRGMRPTRREQDAPRPTPEEHARVKRELEESERERERLQRRIRLERQTPA